MDSCLQIQEELLHAWLSMSVFIRGNRILTDLSFNEIVVCGILFRHQETGQPPLTATELCEQTNLLKSQMNRILTDMECRGFLSRVRSETDRRAVCVHLLEEGRSRYQAEHARVLQILRVVQESMGIDKTKELTALMQQATAIVNDYQKRRL